MRRIYIAGPMTGYEAYNYRAFADAQRKLTDAGWHATTPFDANSRVWKRHYGRPFDPFHDTCEWGDPVLAEMFAEDVVELQAAEAVALLPGWQKSKGAAIEIVLALASGKAFYDAVTCEPLTPPRYSLEVSPGDETILQEAQRLVHGNRGAAYGHPIDDYGRTSRMWEAMLGLEQGAIGPRKAAAMMVAVKLSREMHKPKRDNRTDIAGYAECIDMIASREACS